MKCFILSLSASLALAASAQAVILADFNSSDWADDFAPNPGNTDNYTYSATQGVGGSGAIFANTGDAGNVAFTPTSFDATGNGTTLEFSLDFRITASANTVSDSNPTVRLGIGDDTSGSLSGRVFGDFDATSINTGAGTVTGRLDLNGNGGITGNAFDLNLDTWYTLYYSWETTGGSSGSLSGDAIVRVYNIGTTTVVDAEANITTSLTGRQLDATSFVNMRGDQISSTATTYLDNLTAVPEPSTIAMLAGGLGMLFLLRRRTHR